MLFNIGPGEFVGLAIIAMILVGPERLPKVVVEAAKILKKLRDLAHVATAELKENLGPGFENLEPQDLHPKIFIKKQLADLMEDKPMPAPKNLHAQIDPDLL